MFSTWLNRVKTFTIGWLFALLFWRLVRNFGLESSLEILDINTTPFSVILSIVVLALIAGLIFGSAQMRFEYYYNQNISFRKLLIGAFLGHVFLMLVIYLMIYLILFSTGLLSYLTYKDFLSNPLLLLNLFYSILVNTLILIGLQLSKLLGKGNFTKFLLGKFYTPKEETRVFMFLDLKSSTTIAEQLGHIRYSRFIQDCFYILSIVDQYGAQIYQYVGDEAVLTWKKEGNLALDDCLEAFFAFKEALISKKDYFQEHYGMQPVFKAGIHFGPITTVEVGNLKKEIAYHGDTINVASRIQDQCKVLEAELVISEAVFKRLKNKEEYTISSKGNIALKGRSVAVELYSVIK